MPDPIRGVDNSAPITPTSPASTGQAGAANSAGTADNTAAANATVSGGGADLADVAQTETLLQNILQAASNTPGIDQSKVTELQQAVASGAYKANPQSIAQKLVELEALLGTAGTLQ
jgi:flagellar biosynthesis anti-sigma factor FlgM